MPRARRHAPAGYLYHAMNRRVGRQELFHKPEDYLAFERLLLAAHATHPILKHLH